MFFIYMWCGDQLQKKFGIFNSAEEAMAQANEWYESPLNVTKWGRRYNFTIGECEYENKSVSPFGV